MLTIEPALCSPPTSALLVPATGYSVAVMSDICVQRHHCQIQVQQVHSEVRAVQYLSTEERKREMTKEPSEMESIKSIYSYSSCFHITVLLIVIAIT